ncbi:hypothetical protein AB0A95_30760 [Micromonospora sp. NPDC049230]|uniref:hypothetical protein n=1 Tax=Micromonospora sp. NPDC049230 TaxID=3155502 RepID=UPI0033E64332
MTIDPTSAAAWLDLASRHRTATLVVGGLVVGLLLLAARLLRKQKRRSAALTFAASTVALVFSAEGMWEVARGALHLAKWQAVLLFTFAELLMLFEADQARRKIAENRDPSRHIRAVWIIAAVAALAAASHADNASGQVVRFFMPMAVAWQWASRIKDDLPEAVRQESRWIWTPRRIGIHLGLLKPGSVDDLTAVFRQRRIAALVNAGVALYAEQQAAKLHAGAEPTGRRWWPRRDRLAAATAKLQRLAKTTDPAAVAEARAQLRLTFSIEQALLGQPGEVDDWTREQLDQTSAEARRAALRSKIALARSHAALTRPPRTEPMVELGAIRVPAHVAAQLEQMTPDEPATPSPAVATEPTTAPAMGPTTTVAIAATKRSTVVTKTATKPATKRGRKPATKGTEAERTATAYVDLMATLHRPPTGSELATAAGVSRSYANGWKRDNTPTAKES